MLLLTYPVLLIILVIHSGYIGRQLLFAAQQFLPLAGAGILAAVLNRPYEYVRRFYKEKGKIPEKISRIAGLTTVYLAAVGTVGAVLCFALPRLIAGIQQFIEKRDTYMQSFERSVEGLVKKTGIEQIDISPLTEGISGYLGRLDQTMAEGIPKMARMTTGVLHTLATIGIVSVLSAYILYDKENLKRQIKRLYRIYMPEKLYQPVGGFVRTAMEVFDNFVAGQGLEALILGSLCFLGMFLLGLEYSGVVSFVVGLTSFVPVFGAYIGGGVGILLLMFSSMKKAITFLVFFVLLQQVENNFIYPRVVGKRTGLPGLWVLAAVTVGGGFFGVAGMILSVPTATFLYTLLRRDADRREKLKSTGQKAESDI
jgi:predicted PurR-regulated permease PerM